MLETLIADDNSNINKTLIALRYCASSQEVMKILAGLDDVLKVTCWKH